MGWPYYNGAKDWGIAGATGWVEPMGKHAFGFVGFFSIPDPGESSFLAGYLNNELSPQILVRGFRFPASASQYGDDILIETIQGGDLSFYWPLDLTDKPYSSSRISLRLRLASVEPLNVDSLNYADFGLPRPEADFQPDIRVSFRIKKQRPYRHNVVHPLDGYGMRIRVTGVPKLPDSNLKYIRPDVTLYTVLPGPGLTRFYMLVRGRVQFGRSLPQDYIGFRRTDAINVRLPFLYLGDRHDRVRGYRAYTFGERVLFGTMEYRVPILPDLQTRILGLISLGFTSLSIFADAGVVWSGGPEETRTGQFGTGLELKNALNIAGFTIVHAFGFGQPVRDLGSGSLDWHYRIHAAVPF
jgi:hypothetical protein